MDGPVSPSFMAEAVPSRVPIVFCQFIPFHIPISALINDLCSLFVFCPLLSILCRGGCYRPNLKSSKQVVHLRGYLPKAQTYQPFSGTGCVLLWLTKLAPSRSSHHPSRRHSLFYHRLSNSGHAAKASSGSQGSNHPGFRRSILFRLIQFFPAPLGAPLFRRRPGIPLNPSHRTRKPHPFS